MYAYGREDDLDESELQPEGPPQPRDAAAARPATNAGENGTRGHSEQVHKVKSDVERPQALPPSTEPPPGLVESVGMAAWPDDHDQPLEANVATARVHTARVSPCGQ